MAAKTKYVGALVAAVGALVAVGLLIALMVMLVDVNPVNATYPGKAGKIAYMSYNENDDPHSARWEIYTIWPGGGSKVQLTNDSTPDHITNLYPSYSPNGNRIAYVGHDGKDYEIYTINANGGGKRQLTHNSTDERHPDYGPGASG